MCDCNAHKCAALGSVSWSKMTSESRISLVLECPKLPRYIIAQKLSTNRLKVTLFELGNEITGLMLPDCRVCALNRIVFN